MSEEKKTQKKSAAASKSGEGFEESLTRLKTIVGEMENDELSLDEMIRHFEEGSDLVKTCGEKLDEVEKRIQILVKGADGKARLEPFDEKS